MNTRWSKLLVDAQKFGFAILEERPFTVPRFGGVYKPYNIVAAHPSKSLLLHATSFMFGSTEMANAVEIHGCVHTQNQTTATIARALKHVTVHNSFTEQGIYFRVDLDRQNVFDVLKQVERTAHFAPWNGSPEVINISGYSQQEASANEGRWRAFKTRCAPSWVRKFIAP